MWSPRLQEVLEYGEDEVLRCFESVWQFYCENFPREAAAAEEQYRLTLEHSADAAAPTPPSEEAAVKEEPATAKASPLRDAKRRRVLQVRPETASVVRSVKTERSVVRQLPMEEETAL